MRFAALCVAVCFVTGASVTSSEAPAIAVPDAAVAGISPAFDAAPAESSSPANSGPAPSGMPAAWFLASHEPPGQGFVAPARPQRPALSRTELCGTAVQVAQANNLPAPFFTRLIQQESGFKPHAVSPAGAQGIAQFMPRTASSLGLADPFEPTAALAASGKFLADLVRQFGNLGLAAAAYNAGPKRVRDWMTRRGKLPVETRQYVHSITGHAAEAWAGRRTRVSQMPLLSPASCPDARNPTVEAHLQSRIDPAAPRAPVTERQALPRPSRFVIGLPVSATIKAAERAVVARQKTARSAIRRAERKPTRLASAG